MPATARMNVGTGVHRGAEHNFRQKIQTLRDLPVGEVVDAAVAGVEERWEMENQPKDEGVIDEVRKLAAAHLRYQAPDYVPVAVEQQFSIDWFVALYDCTIDGIFDLVTDTEVVDFKTANRSKPIDEADRSLQFTIYDAAFYEMNKFHANLVMDVLVSTKQIKRQKLNTVRDLGDHDVAYEHVGTVLQAIDKGIFPPTDPTNWWCSSQYCEYASTCRFFRGERKGVTV